MVDDPRGKVETEIVQANPPSAGDPVVQTRTVTKETFKISAQFAKRYYFATLRFGQVILLGSALSFLGLGAQPPVPELGAMASEGRNFLFFAPHIAVVPCVLIFIVVLAFNVLGDALRDALDPRLRV